MSNQKKQVRTNFRNSVFERDKYKCVMCGKPAVDSHHVTDRNLLPGGGYVKENGISVCAECHALAEIYHQTGIAHPGYSPDDLYAKIGSSYDEAYKASLRLGV